MFGQTSTFRSGSLFGSSTASTTTNHNPMKDVEVSQPPEDSVQVLKFSPATVATNFLASGSWDNLVRVWEVKGDGSTEPKAQQSFFSLASGSWDNLVRVWEVKGDGSTEPKAQQSAQGPILSLDWSQDGAQIFLVSADKTVRIWDLASNQMATLGQHEAPVKTCNFVKAPNYSALMTGSWDKTLKFWDPRSPGTAMGTVQLPERDVDTDNYEIEMFPMAVVGTSGRIVKIYRLDNSPSEVKQLESPLKFQHRCVSIFKDKASGAPTGFALGSIEGRVAIQYVEAANPKDNFTFKCHRSPDLVAGFQDIYAVNDIAFHPQHNTLATVGSDGRFSYWDKDARTKLKTSEQLPSPITACAFNKGGEIFAYSSSYDWSKGHEYFKPDQKNYIFIHPCFEDLKPRPKK